MNEKIVNEYYKSSINLRICTHLTVSFNVIENIFLTNIFFYEIVSKNVMERHIS